MKDQSLHLFIIEIDQENYIQGKNPSQDLLNRKIFFSDYKLKNLEKHIFRTF